MKQTPAERDALITSIRQLREQMRLTQPQFAQRIGVAVRTVARWERDHPPHGEVLAKLALLADSCQRTDIKSLIVAALRFEGASHHAFTEPELKAWSEGLVIAFRFRAEPQIKDHWGQIVERIVKVVFLAAHEEEALGDQKSQELYELHRQLEGALDQYR